MGTKRTGAWTQSSKLVRLVMAYLIRGNRIRTGYEGGLASVLDFQPMSRPNVFHNLVTNENSATELLCNAMRFDPLRRAVLGLFFSDACSSKIADVDIDTQVSLVQGRPDLVVSNDEVYSFVEVKVEEHCRLTANQPHGYYNCLLEDKRAQRWLVFLIPSGWFYRDQLKESLRLLNDAHVGSGIQTRIVHWEAVLDVFEKTSLQNEVLSPVLSEFTSLFSSWFLPRSIMFSKDSVRTLYSKDFAVAFSDLLELIKQVGAKGRTLCKCSERSPWELYFKNDEGEYLLWVGFWPDFWKKEGMPISFGVKDDWPEWVQETFRKVYRRETKPFDGWRVGWVQQEDLESSNPLEKTWQQISPLLQALVKTHVSIG